MSSTVITGIGELVTCDGSGADLLGIRHEAAVVIEDDLIAWIGAAAEVPAADTAIDVGGRAIIPGFVDSHSHLIFAGDRGSEFAARMTGQPYDGGGIGVTVAATRAATDEELTRLLGSRIDELQALGTTTHRDQEWLRIDRCRRGTGTPDCSPVHDRGHLSGCPRDTSRIRPGPSRICRSCDGVDAAGRGPVRALDRRLL